MVRGMATHVSRFRTRLKPTEKFCACGHGSAAHTNGLGRCVAERRTGFKEYVDCGCEGFDDRSGDSPPEAS